MTPSITNIYTNQTLIVIQRTLEYLKPLASDKAIENYKNLKALEAKLEFMDTKDFEQSITEIMKIRQQVSEISKQNTIIKLIMSDSAFTQEQKLAYANTIIIKNNIEECRMLVSSQYIPSVEVDSDTLEFIDGTEKQPNVTEIMDVLFKSIDAWLDAADVVVEKIFGLFTDGHLGNNDAKMVLPQLHRMNGILLQWMDFFKE